MAKASPIPERFQVDGWSPRVESAFVATVLGPRSIASGPARPFRKPLLPCLPEIRGGTGPELAHVIEGTDRDDDVEITRRAGVRAGADTVSRLRLSGFAGVGGTLSPRNPTLPAHGQSPRKEKRGRMLVRPDKPGWLRHRAARGNGCLQQREPTFARGGKEKARCRIFFAYLPSAQVIFTGYCAFAVSAQSFASIMAFALGEKWYREAFCFAFASVLARKSFVPSTNR
jgi:hypothetical protein